MKKTSLGLLKELAWLELAMAWTSWAVKPSIGNTHTLSRKMAELCKHMCMHVGVCIHLHMVLCMHVCMCENPIIIHVLCMLVYESDTCMYDT